MSTSSSPPELKWNRFDALVALAVVLLAVVSALCFYLPKNQSGALTVVIDISGQGVRRVPLSDFTEATVTSRGYTLHIAAEGGADGPAGEREVRAAEHGRVHAAGIGAELPREVGRERG